eukprot:TRINITY_DN1127_c0_g1_i2.p3 TRINITY_DN1127_c0_g1~~TRINITY_DN1127_c0_g1_i2.p3  ORF type:complete len:142 (+),score=12.48 TRINITY_DN1127_c0_g1_i2:247-672(+)
MAASGRGTRTIRGGGGARAPAGSPSPTPRHAAARWGGVHRGAAAPLPETVGTGGGACTVELRRRSPKPSALERGKGWRGGGLAPPARDVGAGTRRGSRSCSLPCATSLVRSVCMPVTEAVGGCVCVATSLSAAIFSFFYLC